MTLRTAPDDDVGPSERERRSFLRIDVAHHPMLIPAADRAPDVVVLVDVLASDQSCHTVSLGARPDGGGPPRAGGGSPCGPGRPVEREPSAAQRERSRRSCRVRVPVRARPPRAPTAAKAKKPHG